MLIEEINIKERKGLINKLPLCIDKHDNLSYIK